jgi:hypothetical protein
VFISTSTFVILAIKVATENYRGKFFKGLEIESMILSYEAQTLTRTPRHETDTDTPSLLMKII